MQTKKYWVVHLFILSTDVYEMSVSKYVNFFRFTPHRDNAFPHTVELVETLLTNNHTKLLSHYSSSKEFITKWLPLVFRHKVFSSWMSLFQDLQWEVLFSNIWKQTPYRCLHNLLQYLKQKIAILYSKWGRNLVDKHKQVKAFSSYHIFSTTSK